MVAAFLARIRRWTSIIAPATSTTTVTATTTTVVVVVVAVVANEAPATTLLADAARDVARDWPRY